MGSVRKTIFWCLKSGFVVCLFVFFLFLYNKLRFDNWTDFGYTTINGASEIVEAAEIYGMFNIHFLPLNAKVMFTLLPRICTTGERFWFYPYVVGYSMFLMAPYLIYAFRCIGKKPWIIGSWISVIFIVVMLLFYHNTGAEQFGYRYILDAAAPLVLLIGYGLKNWDDFIFKFFIVFSVCEQFVGMYWWYLGRI